jgi:endonuclease G
MERIALTAFHRAAMARRPPTSALPRSFRRTRVFVVANLLLWGVIGGWYVFQPAPRQREVSRLVANLFDARQQISAFDVGWDLWQLYYGADFVSAAAPGDHTYFYGGAPQLTAAAAGPVRVLTNTGYVVGYSDTLGNPLWAAYRLADGEWKEPAPRPDGFRVDPRTVARIEPADYTRSGYDRGHLAPNYGIATRFGRQAQEETFLMSNISPQKHPLNAGPWKALEQRIATNYPGRFGEVWVLAGPVFAAQPERLKRRVAVPAAFFMIILDEREGRVRAEAFLLPQDSAGDDLGAYLTSIDEIERRTGLDFLSALPDAAEAALESRRADRVW